MLKLSHTTKNVALAALLTAGLAGSAALTLVPVTVHAQDSDDRYYHRDWNDRYYRSDWDHRYYRGDWDDRGWVGIGVPGFGIGFYTGPYHRYYYGCSRWDYYHGYCW